MEILILEDHLPLNQMICESLHEEGIFDKIHVASTICEAHDVVASASIDIFVIDINLPDGNGYEFIKTIRGMQQYEHTWIVVITGSVESADDIIRAINVNHFNRYLKKPFSMQQLVEILDELTGLKVIATGEMKRLKIKRKSIDYFFEYDDIIYFETVDKNVYVYTKDDKHTIGRITLNELENRLPERKFLRVHRSFIVNSDYIDYVQKNNNQNQIKVKHHNTLIPIGRTYKVSQDRM